MAIKTFYEQVYVLKCNNFNTAIVDGQFPASGSFIPVGDFERFVFLIRAGTLNSALTCAVKQVSSIDGTPATLSGATVTIGTSDDNNVYMIEVEKRKMDLTGKTYVTLDVSGAAGGDDYLDILFLGYNAGSQPVTQPASTSSTLVAG